MKCGRFLRFVFSLHLPTYRPIYCSPPFFKWYSPDPDPPAAAYTYPPPDLLHQLIAHYFTNINIFLPLLHRPTFERAVAEGLHLSDCQFGAVVLLVCAHGAKYCDDPRVLLPGYVDTASTNIYKRRTAGWRWFEQVNVFRKSLFEKATLYELQMHTVCPISTYSTTYLPFQVLIVPLLYF